MVGEIHLIQLDAKAMVGAFETSPCQSVCSPAVSISVVPAPI
eukprot:COSAG06_NODE_5323_length_3556_cov_6.122650_3_plen_42_part_00